jgi:hypothetical protein
MVIGVATVSAYVGLLKRVVYEEEKIVELS